MNSGLWKIIIFITVLTLFVIGVQGEDKKCSEYEPTVVTVSGIIHVQTFPGSPNYEDIAKGDKPETYWILKLDHPVCVNANPRDNVNNSYEANVKEIQLVLKGNQYKAFMEFKSKRVLVTGSLCHSVTGHHHTAVLLRVKNIAEDKPEKQSCKEHPMLSGPCFKIRGRMFFSNGTPGIRIWPVGTNRILGIGGLEENENVPDELVQQLSWETAMYADFTICPFTNDEPGVMRLICVESAENISIRKW